jgi:hypothetical protein
MDQLCDTAECCIIWWLPQDLSPIVHRDNTVVYFLQRDMGGAYYRRVS